MFSEGGLLGGIPASLPLLDMPKHLCESSHVSKYLQAGSSAGVSSAQLKCLVQEDCMLV